MNATDLLDRPQTSGQMTSGTFRDPLYTHTLKEGPDGLAVTTRTAVDGVGGAKTIATTPVADPTEAQAYVNAFDRAVLNYASAQHIQTYKFRYDADTGQAVLTDSVPGRGGDPVAGSNDFSLASSKTNTLGEAKPTTVLRRADGEVSYEEGRHFEGVGKLANRAARDHLAHRAEAKVAQDTGHAALPLGHAETVLAEFNQRERRSTFPMRGTDSNPVPENGARFRALHGHIDVVSDPADPAGARWTHMVPKHERGRDKPILVEKASGPLTLASLEGYMSEQSESNRNGGMAMERRAKSMRRATFVEDSKKLMGKAPMPDMPSTMDAPAAVSTPASDAAGKLSGWRKAHAHDAAPAAPKAEQRDVAKPRM